MMNKSQIGWCDFSWNPVTGCKKNCKFCIGRGMAQRLSGCVRLNLGSGQIQYDLKNRLFVLPKPFHTESGSVLQFPAGFEPTFHPYRLRMISDKQKPANIFVSSMGDLFGEWVPLEWIIAVFDACKAAPWHNYLFLTKNPKRYEELSRQGILVEQDNFWYGTRISENTEAFSSERYHTFICMEPLGPFAEDYPIPPTEWIILGYEDLLPSKRNMPKRSWADSIISRKGDIPVYMKKNNAMKEVWSGRLIQEKPKLLQRPPDKPIPHCLQCKYCYSVREGKRGDRHTCRHRKIMSKFKETNGRHIPGRFVRTSPAWCPKR